MSSSFENRDDVVKIDLTKKRTRGGEISEIDLSNEEIKEIIKDIRASKLNSKKREEFFEKKYSDFNDRYPYLFNMACGDSFDETTLNYMLSMRSQIRSNQMSEYDASKIIGQKFYDKYMNKS
jgi:hypothetical protein